MAEFVIDIPAGIVLDDTSYDVGVKAWRDCEKVRFVRGRPEVIGGWEVFQLEPLQGVCRNLLGWSDGLGASYIAFGTHTHLSINYGGALYDVTPAGLAAGQVDGTGGRGFGTGAYGVGAYSEPSTVDYFPRTWALATWGASLMANPRGGTIYWSTDPQAEDAGTGAPALANAPANVTFMTVARQRQVMAYGCNEELSGDFNPMCIRHSDIEGPTTWTTASDNNAGEIILEGSGRLVSAAGMGDRQLAWSDKTLFLGTFIGDAGQSWRFEEVAGSAGMCGPNARAVIGQRAYWLTPELKLMGYALGGEPQEIVGPVLSDMLANIDMGQVDKISASTLAAKQEIRFDYPDKRDGGGLECSRYVAFTMSGDGNSLSGGLAWSRGMMARTAYADVGGSTFPLAADPDGVVYLHERGVGASGGKFRAWVESADIYADDANNAHVETGVWTPDFARQLCPVSLTITGRNMPNSAAVRPYGPFTAGIAAERVGTRAEGRLVRLRFESYSAENSWRAGRHVIDMRVTGSR